MRIARVLTLALPLLALGCKAQGTANTQEMDTRRPASGGFTSQDDSAAYHSALEGAPSGAQPAMTDASTAADDLGLPSEATVPQLPRPPAEPPAPQKETPTPKGKAGGTLD